MADRDAHGNVNVSKIETDKLIITLLEKELADKKAEGKYTGSFSP